MSGKHRQAEVGGPLNPQQYQEPRFISDPNPYAEQEWNQLVAHDPLVVISAEASEDDEPIHSVVKAPPTRP